MPTKLPHSALWSTMLLLLHGCATAPVSLDPFDRPRAPETMMAPGPLRVCVPKDVDQLPYLESGAKPLYPIRERILGRTAVAKVVFTVNPDGTVTHRPIDPSNGAQWFLQHAAVATRDWKVRPALKDGKPVESTCQLHFNYVLR
jgi:TonB family protein